MLSVGELLQHLTAQLERCERSAMRAPRGDLKQLVTGTPLSLSGDLDARLRAIDPTLVLPSPLPAGVALGVVVLPADLGARVVQLHVSIDESEERVDRPTPAAMSAYCADSVSNAAYSALHLFPHHYALDPDHDLRFEVRDLSGAPLALRREDLLDGASLGLTALMATWSLLARAPLPTVAGGLAPVFTGGIGHGRYYKERAIIEEVSRVHDKALEVARAGACLVLSHADLDHIGLDPGAAAAAAPLSPPKPAGLTAVGVHSVAQALGFVFGERWSEPDSYRDLPPFDPDVSLEILDLAYLRNGDGLRYGDLGARFEHVARQMDLSGRQRSPERARALARSGACWSQLNQTGRALKLLTEAVQVIEASSEGSVEGEIEVVARTHLAVTYRDLYRFDEAADEARRALALARRCRLVGAGVDARSTLGQILVASGDAEAGLAHVSAAREYYDRRGSFQCPRNHTYEVEALGRLGRLELAREAHALGLAHNRRRAEPDQRRNNRSYLDYALLSGRLRATRRAATWDWAALEDEATRALEGLTAPWPRIGLERIRLAALARRSSDRAEAEVAALLKGASSQGALTHWHAGLVALELALARLEAGAGSEATRPLLTLGLAPLEDQPDARVFFAEELARLEGDALRSTLLSILEREQY